MYLKSFSNSIVLISKKITTLVFEKNFTSTVSIIEELKTSISDCQKFENKIMIKRRVMFEKLLIVFLSSFFLINESSFYIFFAMFLFRFFHFLSFFSVCLDSYLNNYRIFLLQQQHFVQKSDFFRFVAFYFSSSLFSSHKISFENHSLMFSFWKNLFRNHFIGFFFREIFFFQLFFYRFKFFFSLFVVTLMFEILCRSMFFFCFWIL